MLQLEHQRRSGIPRTILERARAWLRRSTLHASALDEHPMKGPTPVVPGCGERLYIDKHRTLPHAIRPYKSHSSRLEYAFLGDAANLTRPHRFHG